jgi:hypothetical protein
VTKVAATLDHWHGVFDKPTDFANVDIRTITELVGRLDARKHTLLSLSTADGRVLMIGGGQGAYVVCRIDVDGRSATLTGPGSSGRATITLCVGGQEGDYPENQICTAADALCAAEGFFTEHYPGSMNWVTD